MIVIFYHHFKLTGKAFIKPSLKLWQFTIHPAFAEAMAGKAFTQSPEYHLYFLPPHAFIKNLSLHLKH